MSNMREDIEYKNNKINKVVSLLKNDYLNKNILQYLDVNPTHFIDSVQFTNYMYMIISHKDGHFYYPDIISNKHSISYIVNPYGYLCIDYNKMRAQVLKEIRSVPHNKVVIDLRGCNIYNYHANYMVSVLCSFSCVRDKLNEGQIIYTFKDSKDNIVRILKYTKGKLIHIYNGEITDTFKLKKPIICDEVICIGLQQTILTHVIGKLGIPVYIENDDENQIEICGVWTVSKCKFPIPSLRIQEENIGYKLGIPEKYYPGI